MFSKHEHNRKKNSELDLTPQRVTRLSRQEWVGVELLLYEFVPFGPILSNFVQFEYLIDEFFMKLGGDLCKISLKDSI